MNIFLKELSFNLKSNKLLNLFFIIQISLFLILTSLSAIVSKNFDNHRDDFERYFKEKNVISILDIPEAFDSLFDKQNIEENIIDLNRAYTSLNQGENDKYILSITQDITLSFIKNSQPILELSNNSGHPDQYDESSVVLYPSMRVNQNFFKYFNINISQGDLFSLDDYSYNHQKPIPLILGSNWNGILNVGDTIIPNPEFHSYPIYVDEDHSYIIKGILDKDVYFNDSNNIISLNNQILIPGGIINSSQTNNENIARNLSQIFSGNIIQDKNSNYNNMIWTSTVNNKTFSDYFQSIDKSENLEISYQDIKKISTISSMILGLVLIFSIISITSSFAKKIEKNRTRYSIHLAQGARYQSVILFILSDLIFILICSLVLSYISVFIMKFILAFSSATMLNILSINIIISIIILFIAYISALFLIKNMSISKFIRGIQI